MNPGTKEIIEFLKKDEIKNCSHIGFIYNNKINSITKTGNYIIIKGRSDRDWVYISCSNEKELELSLNEIDSKDKCFAVIEDWMMPVFMQRYKLKWKLSVLKFVLKKRIKNISRFENISPLRIEDAEYIYLNSLYKEYLSVEYIKERIENGISAGICIYTDGKLAAWGITQDDNAIGFLHVLDSCRGKGFAKQIVEYIALKISEANFLPFAYIQESNTPAINLVQKIGFQKINKVHWFEIE
jgi:8-oxo-dGTP diphosphatase